MGQRTPRSAHYNKGIWKKRNARYYDDQAKNSPRKPKGTGHIKQKPDWSRAPGHHCHPNCGCGKTGHFDENRRWVFD